MSLLSKPAVGKIVATPPGINSFPSVLTEEQHTSLSQLIIDECITMEIRGTDDGGLLIASCGVIDSWIQRQLRTKIWPRIQSCVIAFYPEQSQVVYVILQEN